MQWIQRAAKQALRGGVISLALWGATAAHASVSYRVTNIGEPFVDQATWATGINNLGQVVGRSMNDGPFLWTPGSGFQSIGYLPGGTSGEALGVNDLGQVVGYNWMPDGSQQAFVWSASTGIQRIADLPGSVGQTHAIAINNAGQVVGYSSTSHGDQPFIWSAATGTQVLSGFGGSTTPVGRAQGINSAGQVVGWSQTDNRIPHGFVWTADGGMQDIGLPATNDLGYLFIANGINSSGQIIGTGGWGGGYGSRPFLYTPDGTMTSLEMLANEGTTLTGNAINDAGTVVGTSDARNGSGRHYAFVWTPDGGMQKLDALVDPNDPLLPGLALSEAVAINNAGQIVGQAAYGLGYYRTFLLTPVPEPSSALLLALGLGVVAFLRRQPR